jgi:hypothetical protein
MKVRLLLPQPISKNKGAELSPRHGVFGRPGLPDLIAERLRDPEKITRARVFPYQLMIAYTMANANADIPKGVCDALQDAMEMAIANVPRSKAACMSVRMFRVRCRRR